MHLMTRKIIFHLVGIFCVDGVYPHISIPLYRVEDIEDGLFSFRYAVCHFVKNSHQNHYLCNGTTIFFRNDDMIVHTHIWNESKTKAFKTIFFLSERHMETMRLAAEQSQKRLPFSLRPAKPII